MKNFILGFLIGVAVLLAFLYLGGPRYLVALGIRAQEAGQKLEHYEKPVKNTVNEAGQSVDKALDKTKMKVREYIRK